MESSLKHVYFFVDHHETSQLHEYDSSTPTSPANDSVVDSFTSSAPVRSGSSATSSISVNPQGLNPHANDFTPLVQDSAGVTKIETLSKPCYELRASPGQGMGLFATRFIEVGTQIICERPLLRITRNEMYLVWEQYCRLSPEHKALYDKLHFNRNSNVDLEQASRVYLLNNADTDLDSDDEEEFVVEQVRVMGLFATNNFIMANRHLGVFANASRINHSCVPNVYCTNNPSLGYSETVHAARDIHPGEQLLTSYLSGPGSYWTCAQRLEFLQKYYGFTCQCPACTDRTGNSDTKRELLGRMVFGLQQYLEGAEQHADLFVPGSPTSALKQAEDAIRLLLEQSLVTQDLMKTYRFASRAALDLEDYEKALGYGLDEAQVEENILGTSVDDLKKIGAASEIWLLHVVEAMAQAGIKLNGVPRLLRRKWLRSGQAAKTYTNARKREKEHSKRRD